MGAPDDDDETGNVYECPLQKNSKCTKITIPEKTLPNNIGKYFPAFIY